MHLFDDLLRDKFLEDIKIFLEKHKTNSFMTDIEEFVYKISFIDFHLLEQQEELIRKLKEALEFEQTKQKEGIEDIIKHYPLEFPLELQREEIEYLNKEQNIRILFIKNLIKLVQELSIPQEIEESSGENRNSPKSDSEN